MAPVNDDFVNRITLATSGGSRSNDTCIDATLEVGEATTWASNDQSVWYEFQPDTTGLWRFDVTGITDGPSGCRMDIVILSGDPFGSYSFLSYSSTYVPGVGYQAVDYPVYANLDSSLTYKVRVSASNPGTINDLCSPTFDLAWALIPPSPPPLYDDIIDAYELSPSGGTVTIDTNGATLQTNESNMLCSVAYSNWLKVDLSALVGTGTGVGITVDAERLSGDVAPYLIPVFFDASFDPATPDFDLVLAFPDQYGDGTADPPPQELIFDPDVDGNPTGVYWIAVGDDSCNGFGEIQLDWDAFVEIDCGDAPTIGPVTVLQTFAGGALIEVDVCAGSYTTDVRAQYGPTTSYTAGTTDNITIPAGHTFVTLQLLIYDCGGFDLSPSTLYHFRVVADSHGPYANVNGSDHTFTTDALPGPPANDDIANAIVISGATGSIDGDNTSATLETGEGALLYDVDNGLFAPGDIGYGGGRSVWYEWTAPADGDYGFWTDPIGGSHNFDGLCDTLVTVLGGSNFGTATVMIQNEYAQGQPAGYTGPSDYPQSLSQITATGGQTYFVAVDGYNGNAPSDGGYDINDTYQGPFRLYWGAAVPAEAAIRNPVLLSVTATTATFQFEINPQSPTGGDYWADARNNTIAPFTFDGPHLHESAGFVWSTVTSTVTGLQPNTPYGELGVGTNEVNLTNDRPFATGTSSPGLYTLMPDEFGGCPVDVSDDLAGDNCIAPDGSTMVPPTPYSGWNVTDGYRIQGDAMGAYEWQEANQAVLNFGDETVIANGNALNAKAYDIGITLSEVGGKQDVGFLHSTGSKYFTRSDADLGKLQLIRYDIAGNTEVVLDEITESLSDGDGLGCRYSSITEEIDGYKRVGGVWTHILHAADSTYTIAADNFVAFFAQSAPAEPPPIDDSMCFDLAAYGTTDGSLGCPAGTDKYTWGFVGFHRWYPTPYWGGAAANDYPNPAQDCPNWWLSLKVHARGRLDCDLRSLGNAGDDDFMQSYFSSTLGITAALLPFYPATAEYDAELDQYEDDESAGFLIWDTDFAHKGIDAIQSTLDTVQAAFAADGAVKINNVGDGGRNSYGVFMPVAVAPGRIADFFLSFERCAVNFGPVSFSHLTTTRRRGVLSVR